MPIRGPVLVNAVDGTVGGALDRSNRHRGEGDRVDAESGEIGVGVMLAVTLTFVVAVGIVHMFMFLYGQAVVRAALDEGVRAGSRVEAGVAVCQERSDAMLADLLGGKLGDGVSIVCWSAGDGVLVAEADAHLASTMPGVPSWRFHLEARATQEMGGGG